MIKKLLFILLTLVIYFAISCTCNSNPFTPYEITATDSLSVTLVSPANGATNQDTSVILSWSGTAETYDVYLGTDSTSLSKIISTDSTNCIKSGLSKGTTYFWRVVGIRGSVSDTSVIRFFTTKINVSLISPTNGATNQDTSVTLNWSGTAETYDVYLGTDSTSLSKIISTDSTNCIKSGLNKGTTYFWRVVGIRGSVSDTSVIRFFTTKIDVSLISPTNGATNQDTSVTLNWSGTAETYDVYLGTDSSSLTKIYSTNSTSYTKSGLNKGTKYYWKVVGNKGSVSSASDVWNFTTKISVLLISPANGATEQPTDLTFSWSGTAETYDVYLGTDSTSLSKIASNLTATTYTKNGLDEITTYYWKVVGTKGSVSGTSGERKFITKLNLNLEMVAVDSGTFQMGLGTLVATDTVHSVTISKSFEICKYEITNDQVVRVYNLAKKKLSGLSFSSTAVTYNSNKILDLEAGACYIEYASSSDTLYVEEGKGKYPVTVITWEGATSFAEFMNALSGTDKYRLPTEAEWEFAARGGKSSNGYIYAGSNTIGDVAWYLDHSSTTDNTSSNWKTNPVGKKNPNELGIYDMSGNVGELCSDRKGNYSSSSQTDPTGASSGTERVYRGGSWCHGEDICRVYCRSYTFSSTSSSTMIGFRIARSK